MPLYAWKGIDLKGIVHKGTLSASSYDLLKKRLEYRSIGLISAHSISAPAINQQQFCSQLASLLEAHLPLPTALSLMATLTKGRVIVALAESVAEGVMLSEALVLQQWADELTIAVVKAGESTGDLGAALKELVQHTAEVEKLKKKLRGALLVPVFTFCFFVLMLLIILGTVVPRFEPYYTLVACSVPYSTQVLLAASRFLRSCNALYAFLGVLCSCILLWRYSKSSYGSAVRHNFIRKIPGIRSLIVIIYNAQFLRGLGILLIRKVRVVEALHVCSTLFSSSTLQEEVLKMSNLIQQGNTFSVAYRSTSFASLEAEACIVLGESTGRLESMIQKGADFYQNRAYTLLEKSIAWVNPLFLIVLGGLIAAFMSAIYIPLMTLPLSQEWLGA